MTIRGYDKGIRLECRKQDYVVLLLVELLVLCKKGGEHNNDNCKLLKMNGLIVHVDSIHRAVKEKVLDKTPHLYMIDRILIYMPPVHTKAAQ